MANRPTMNGSRATPRPDGLNEARAVNQVRHENIVEITDLGTTAGGRLYIVMEMLDGIDLARLLAGVNAVPEARAAHIGEQIASALGAAHRAGVIHRDLKPANVMLIQRRVDCDFVKLLDFRVAKPAPVEDGTDGTRAGALLGTPRYMSPEQAQGLPIDHRSDLYSLGVLLYEMVTGQAPFHGKAADVLSRHVNEAPIRPCTLMAALGAEMEQVILRCLEKDPARRPRDALEVEQALRAVGLPHRPGVGLLARPVAPTASGNPGCGAATACPSPTP